MYALTHRENEPAFTKDFKFSGNNYSARRKFVVVDNNAINKEQIRPQTTTSTQNNFRMSTRSQTRMSSRG